MRHERFEDLKYRSDLKATEAAIPTGWPKLSPRIIH
jgi:hypothetical protein